MGRLGSIAWFLLISFALTVIANWRYFTTPEINPKSYITPKDEEIVKLVYNLTGGWEKSGDWNELIRDVYRMYDWIMLNINPDFNKTNWRTPKETLVARSAKCIDYATLLCSMIRCYAKINVYCIAIEDRENGAGHASIQIILPNKTTIILDPAIHYTTGKPKPIEAETLNYIETLKATFPLQLRKPEITYAFNDETSKTFTSTKEYIEWIKKVN